jgi:hypothetical protein
MKKLHLGVLIATLLIVVGGLLGYTLVRSGTFPVALVNGKVIFLSTVQENVDASIRLYEQSPELLSDESVQLLFKRGSGKELFKKTFESLIINTIIKTKTSSEMKDTARDKIDMELRESDLATLRASVDFVYEWDFSKFRERILEPQAIEEILVEEKGEDFESWLDNELNSANVNIWFLPFEWERGELRGK